MGRGGGLAGFLRHKRPELRKINRGFELLITLEMEVALTSLTEEPGMARVIVKGVLVLTTSPS
jgi:hypothetical protein